MRSRLKKLAVRSFEPALCDQDSTRAGGVNVGSGLWGRFTDFRAGMLGELRYGHSCLTRRGPLTLPMWYVV
jgi:hypothetical protein